MFQLNNLDLRLEHQHEDGSWATFEPRPSHHDPVEHDPERGWAKGRICGCTGCDEQILVSDPASEGGPGSPKR